MPPRIDARRLLLSISFSGFLTRVLGRFQAFAHLVKGRGVDLAACVASAQDLHCRWLLRLRPEMLWSGASVKWSSARRRRWETVIIAFPVSSPCQETDEQSYNQSYDQKCEQAAHQHTCPPYTNTRTN